MRTGNYQAPFCQKGSINLSREGSGEKRSAVRDLYRKAPITSKILTNFDQDHESIAILAKGRTSIFALWL
jgi:hypothetical protein